MTGLGSFEGPLSKLWARHSQHRADLHFDAEKSSPGRVSGSDRPVGTSFCSVAQLGGGLRRIWAVRAILSVGTMSLGRAHLDEFGILLANAKKITVLTGAGVSAESGIPTFRGKGGLWRTWSAMELATPESFKENPSLVWEFYHYRRCVVDKALPNGSHYALAAFQKRCKQEGKEFTLLTQNIDELHMRAGSEDVVELHGSLWKTRCTKCKDIRENRTMPICAALDGRGAPDTNTPDARIPVKELPRCQRCGGLLRPHVVWFGESLYEKTLDQADNALQDCDLLLVAGTSALVWPAAGYAPLVRSLGGTVAEFNIVDTPASPHCDFKFRGPSASTIPEALGIPLAQLPGTSTTEASN